MTNKNKKNALPNMVSDPLNKLMTVSWRDMMVLLIPGLLLTIGIGWLGFTMIRPAPPDILVIAGGQEGSSFENNAKKYAALIAKHGIKVKIVTTDGSEENLDLLQKENGTIDVGFVQAGLVDEDETHGIMSLGTMYVQPFMVFYRGRGDIDHLTELKGKKIAIGPEGSGNNTLSLKLLKENGMTATDATLLEIDGDDAIDAFRQKKVDAIFTTSELTRTQTMRELMRLPNVHLMNFLQADGYLRHLPYLSRLTAPKGSFDLGLDIPKQDIQLIGTPVELIARSDLHPAISDLLLEAAHEVHGKPGMFRKPKEFPDAVEHIIPLSEEARRYYTSGSPLEYRRLPFWLASLVDRILIVLVPSLIVLIPLSRAIPPLYRWRIRSRIYRWYGILIKIEREMQLKQTPEQLEELHQRLVEVENSVDNLHLPIAFADQLYVLREHINMVRLRFDAMRAA
jgi:TRAP transporter TAXI family solute receptor